MTTDLTSRRRSDGTAEKRDRIVEAAMRLFAEHGYEGSRLDDVAHELEIAKGSILQHFGSKARLFLECYKRAVLSFPAWLDAPVDVQAKGFFAVIDYWLERTDHLVVDHRVAYRVAMIGNYGTDLALKREINRWLVSEDPYGTLDFVEWGQRRGEVRTDVDLEMMVSMLDWLTGALQDALVTEELDPGLFHRPRADNEHEEIRVQHFAALLKSALGTSES